MEISGYVLRGVLAFSLPDLRRRHRRFPGQAEGGKFIGLAFRFIPPGWPRCWADHTNISPTPAATC
jgi:hypothetical protein